MNNIVVSDHVSVVLDNASVLSDVSFKIQEGDYLGLVGPNGGGKTTLIRTLLGVITPSRGSVTLWGSNPQSSTSIHRVGYLPQHRPSTHTPFPASVAEVVRMGTATDAVDEFLAEFGLTQQAQTPFRNLSGGQQQKVLLARAFACRPRLLILDEPSTGLDSRSREEFFTYIETVRSRSALTVILISHDTGQIGTYANKILYIDQTVKYFGDVKDYCQSEDTDACFHRHGDHLVWHQHS